MAAAILAVVGIPVVYSLYLSFHQWKLATFKQGVPFVGLDNYLKAIGDDGFWHSLQLTLGFMVVALAVEIVLGIALAVGLALPLAWPGVRPVSASSTVAASNNSMFWKVRAMPNLAIW